MEWPRIHAVKSWLVFGSFKTSSNIWCQAAWFACCSWTQRVSGRWRLSIKEECWLRAVLCLRPGDTSSQGREVHCWALQRSTHLHQYMLKGVLAVLGRNGSAGRYSEAYLNEILQVRVLAKEQQLLQLLFRISRTCPTFGVVLWMHPSPKAQSFLCCVHPSFCP